MFRPLATSARPRPIRRRGALLIAVLGLLTLFAIFALFFVFYADNEANGARIYREGESEGDSGPPNDYAISAYNATMSSIIFDTYDNTSGVMNPLRGHSLARSMYGWNGTFVGPSASAPFYGIGTFHEQSPNGVDRAAWINFSAPFVTNGPLGLNGYWLDPEWTGWRTSSEVNSGTLPGGTTRTLPLTPQIHVPKNAPYTYPDLKDLILASLSPATGEVLVPSLHRNWLFNGGNPNPTQRLAPWNPNDDPAIVPTTTTFWALNADWVNPDGRSRILRPRPMDQLTASDLATISPALPSPIPAGFFSPSGGASMAQKTQLFNLISSRIAAGLIIPYPPFNAELDGSGNRTYTGDVQNLMGGVGFQKNDSILIDIGLPPRKWNGKWIKPLASILLSDLDGLLNLNAHGNMRGGASTAPGYDRGFHKSYSGYGPHEVNLGAVLGNAEAVNIVQARYGVASWQPGPGGMYREGDTVVNAGNFYRCIAPPAAGPRAMAALTGPGPTGTYPLASPYVDGVNGVQWVDINITLTRNGLNSQSLDRSGRPIPLYAPVNFDAGGNTPTYTAPSFPGNAFHTYPQITSNGNPQSFFNEFADTYNRPLNHPLLFNSHDWPVGTAPRIFGFGDLKRFTTRYATDRDYYLQTDVARSGLANTSLIGTPGTYGGNNYRLDPAHVNRGLLTTFSSHLDRAYQVSNFNTSTPGLPSLTAVQLQAGQLHPTSTAFTGIFSPGTGADFVGATDLRNPRAALGGMDLNRPLSDYRFDTNVPLSNPNNVVAATATQAHVDRHNLARDILGRLIQATGANATVFTATATLGMPPVTYHAGDILINATVGSDDYNAIRYLAQLAANIVDLIDSDDVSTAFAWDTGAAWTTPRTITQVSSADIQAMITLASAQQGALVFGVEKPRLVINEAYGEITNDPAEMFMNNQPATQNPRVRFWVELMNPTGTPYGGTGVLNGPLGTGAVQVHNGNFNPYRLIVTQMGVGNANELFNPANTKGDFNYAPTSGFMFDFSPVAAAQRSVIPLNGNYPQASSFLVVGAQDFGNNQHSYNGTPIEFRLNVGDPRFAQGTAYAANSTTAMEYDFGPIVAAANFENANNMNPYRRHAVVLQRLANPYIAHNPQTNPYVTVDLMDRVPAFDAVARGGGGADTSDRTPKTAPGITQAGFEPVDDTSGGTRRYSVGKVQPYAGASNFVNPRPANDVDAIDSFPRSMVIRANQPNPALAAGEPLHTFFRNNSRNAAAPIAQTYNIGPPANLIGNETLMAPFDWFVHYDRPLVNQIELLSLQATKPHEVTQYTLRSNAGGALFRNYGLAPWLGWNTTTSQPGFDLTTNRTNNGLYRALETLRVKPWVNGLPHGGKQHGRLNLNTIQDGRVLQALLDPAVGNVFTNADVNRMWTGTPASGMTPAIPGFITNNPGAPVVGSRTPNSQNRAIANGGTVQVPVPGQTYDDVPNPNDGVVRDRPFRPLSAAEFTQDGSNAALAARYGSGLQDTFLRVNSIAGSPTFGAPLVSVPGQTQPYMQAEMLRKLFNNATTTSHAFAVTVTIVFHEVRMNGTNMEVINDGIGNRFVIGKEAYKEIPGDLRQQFFSVIDRSSIGIVPSTTTLQTQPFTGQFESITPVTSITTPPVPPYIAHPGALIPTYNMYLWNASPPAGPNPYPQNGFPYWTTIYMDGRPIRIGSGGYTGPIVVGTGTKQEVMNINYVNEDGSINVTRSDPTILHSPGEVVASFVTGHPGPVNPGNASNPGPFDPLSPTPNNPYRAIVPYAQRIR